MLRFLKNKKGTEMIETIIFLPVALYLIFLTVFRMTAKVEENGLKTIATYYSRQLSIARDLKVGLDSLMMLSEEHPTYSIRELTIGGRTMIFERNENPEGMPTSKSFLSYLKEENGAISFDVEKLSLNQSYDYSGYAEAFVQGAETTIYVETDITNNTIGDIFKLTYTDPVDKKTYVLTTGMGVDTLIHDEVYGVVYHENQ